MKAAIATARGAARDVLRIIDTETPAPGPGEVLVRIQASGVNPSDVKLRSGAQGPMIADQVRVHNDGAGVITALGPGVDDAREGEHAWLYNVNRTGDGMGQGPNGTAAEYVAVPQELAVAMPEATPFDQAACLGVPAMTAYRALFWAGDVMGKVVLVTGGAGSVGHLAVQMAHDAGAVVATTVSGDAKAELARKAGADLIINYREQDVATELAKAYGANGVDHIVDVDFASTIRITPEILRRNGTIGAYASGSDLTPCIPYYPVMFNNTAIQTVFVYALPRSVLSAAAAHISAMLARDALVPVVDRRFELDEIVAAHEAVESGTLQGNAVLTLD